MTTSSAWDLVSPREVMCLPLEITQGVQGTCALNSGEVTQSDHLDVVAAVKGDSCDPESSTELSSAPEISSICRSGTVDNSTFKLLILSYKNLKINNTMKWT